MWSRRPLPFLGRPNPAARGVRSTLNSNGLLRGRQGMATILVVDSASSAFAGVFKSVT
jgi:hypothetical protein